MGEKADDIFASLPFERRAAVGDNPAVDESTVYETVKAKFEDYFIVRHNTIYERAKFNVRTQQGGEAIDGFITDLHTLSEHCQYGALREELIRDRIVVGIKDKGLSEKMQMNRNLTLAIATDMSRHSAQVKTQAKEIYGTGEKGEISALNSRTQPGRGRGYTRGRGRGRGNNRTPSTPQQKDVGDKQCQWCGGPTHDRSQCPARNAQCHRCKTKGHYGKVCKRRSINELAQQELEYTDYTDYEEVFLGAVQTDQGKWTVPVQVDGHDITFRVDTGADVSVVSKAVFDSIFPHTKLQPPSKTIKGADKKPIKPHGCFKASVTFKDKKVNEEIYVFQNANNLLSGTASHNLGIVAFVGVVVEEEFPSLFSGLGKLEATYDIKLQEDARPYSVCTPRRIPLPLMPKLKKELDRLQKQEVISPVVGPTEWCAPIVCVPKPSGAVRLCVDLTKLNTAVCRERHLMPSVDYVLAQIGQGRVFSKLDANSGFHQVQLSENSRKLTTFITPFGRYCYNRLPFGISSAPEYYQKQISSIIEGLPGVACLMDDIVVFGSTQDEHDSRLRTTLTRLQNAGVTLNKDKCEMNKTSLNFLGHVVGKNGISPDPDKISAIEEYPAPTDVSELRRFLGMANQLGKFTPEMANMTQSLRELLRKKNSWCWGPAQECAFKQIKTTLSSSPVLALYDIISDTKVSADASSYGLGGVLLQKRSDAWRPVAYASRSLSDTEKRYSQIDKEALATTWACERFKNYLIGRTFHIETDHKPLVPLLGTKDVDELPPRVQRYRMRLMRFNYTISHVPGSELFTADALSRAPSSMPSQADQEIEDESMAYVSMITESFPASDSRLEQIIVHQTEDEVCREISQYVQEGWPDKSRIKGLAKHYWTHRGELNITDQLLLCGSRIVIPVSLRSEILDKIHEGHQGIVKCREMAKNSVWWPGISAQLGELVEQCRVCTMNSNNKMEPLIPSIMPDRPWQKVATDLFEFNKSHYVLVVDYYSRFIEVRRLEQLTSRVVINHLKSIFTCHGLPEIVISDNGPQYSAEEFEVFSHEYGFTHICSSPKHSSGNGEAERAVKTTKALLKAAKDPYIAMLNYRNTPLANGHSPAQLSMARSLRTKVPVAPQTLQFSPPEGDHLRKREQGYRDRMKLNFDKHHAAKALPPLEEGEEVWIPDRKESGTVSNQGPHSRSYIINTPEGGQYRRNRSMVNKLYPEREEPAEQPPIQPATPMRVMDYHSSKSPTTSTNTPVRCSGNSREMPVTTTATPPRRSGRLREAPAKLKDYVAK